MSGLPDGTEYWWGNKAPGKRSTLDGRRYCPLCDEVVSTIRAGRKHHQAEHPNEPGVAAYPLLRDKEHTDE